VLADELAALAARAPGDLRVLRRYARARREDVSAMQFVTDRLDACSPPRARALVAAQRRPAAGRGAAWAKAALAGGQCDNASFRSTRSNPHENLRLPAAARRLPPRAARVRQDRTADER
jgi:2-polyprenyl-6-methoxyphenol hydroxylase-like FAD-dependent oxidoreductase